jgi:hypothetical protein
LVLENHRPQFLIILKEFSFFEIFSKLLQIIPEIKLKKYNKNLFTKINKQILASVGKSFRIGILESDFFGIRKPAPSASIKTSSNSL